MRKKEVGDQLHYYGFSLGANALLEIGEKLRLDKIILISPMPLFKDTYRKMEGRGRGDNDNYVRDNFLNKTLGKTCGLIVSEISVYVGELEDDYSKEIAKKIAFNLGEELNIIDSYGCNGDLFDYVYNL